MILVAWYVLKESSDPEIWNHLFLFLTFFAVVTFLARLWFVESPEWLALHGKVEEAEKNVKHFLGQDVYIGELASKKDKTTRPQSSRRDIFARTDREHPARQQNDQQHHQSQHRRPLISIVFPCSSMFCLHLFALRSGKCMQEEDH